jgi:hypothetical protein
MSRTFMVEGMVDMARRNTTAAVLLMRVAGLLLLLLRETVRKAANIMVFLVAVEMLL